MHHHHVVLQLHSASQQFLKVEVADNSELKHFPLAHLDVRDPDDLSTSHTSSHMRNAKVITGKQACVCVQCIPLCVLTGVVWYMVHCTCMCIATYVLYCTGKYFSTCTVWVWLVGPSQIHCTYIHMYVSSKCSLAT